MERAQFRSFAFSCRLQPRGSPPERDGERPQPNHVLSGRSCGVTLQLARERLELIRGVRRRSLGIRAKLQGEAERLREEVFPQVDPGPSPDVEVAPSERRLPGSRRPRSLGMTIR